MIERIKILYAKIDDKQRFIELVATKVNKGSRTLQNHWFSAFFSIPKKYQIQVIELLEQTIKSQIKQLTLILKSE